MIYLFDYHLKEIPKDAELLVYIGNMDYIILDTSVPIGFLAQEISDILDLGAKVQFWHQENGMKEFRVLTTDRKKYGNYVANSRFD